MEIYLLEAHSWLDLLLLAGGLLLVYFLFEYSLRVLCRVSLLGRGQTLVVRILHTSLLIYEPLAVL
ncbi:MAG: hypothetical protein D6772_07675, partial [Bacteroidetes bacterium]